MQWYISDVLGGLSFQVKKGRNHPLVPLVKKKKRGGGEEKEKKR